METPYGSAGGAPYRQDDGGQPQYSYTPGYDPQGMYPTNPTPIYVGGGAYGGPTGTGAAIYEPQPVSIVGAVPQGSMGPPKYRDADAGPASSSSSDQTGKGLALQVAKLEALTTALFMRKVYALLCIQLLITCIIGGVMGVVRVYHSEMGIYVPIGYVATEAIWPLVVSIVVALGTLIPLMFVYDKVPANYILLGVYTVSWSVFIGCIAGIIGDDGAVFAAFVITLGTFMVCTALCWLTRFSEKTLFMAVMAVLSAFILTIIVYFIWVAAVVSGLDSGVFWGDIIWIGLFCCIFSLYIIIDTYVALESKYDNGYIYACARIYTDIIILLFYLLILIGGSR